MDKFYKFENISVSVAGCISTRENAFYFNKNVKSETMSNHQMTRTYLVDTFAIQLTSL